MVTRPRPTNPHASWRYEADPALRPGLAAWREERFNNRLAAYDAAVPGWSADWGRVVARIRSLTGRPAEVVVPVEQEDQLMLRLFAAVSTLTGPPTELIALARNQCHENAHALAVRKGWHFATGFAGRLDEPVVEWRRHSWCAVPGTGRIVETTEAHFHPATRYVGVAWDVISGGAAG